MPGVVQLRSLSPEAADLLDDRGTVMLAARAAEDDHDRFWTACRARDLPATRHHAAGLLVNRRMKDTHWAALWEAEAGMDAEASAQVFAAKTIAMNLPEPDPALLDGPDFIIIGTMKGGTSSLYEYICRHSRVQPRRPKELHAFTTRGPMTPGAYRTLFAARAPGRVAGEASPSYFDWPDPTIPARIASAAPRAKLLAILAHPTQRAVSEYYHNLRVARAVQVGDAFVAPQDVLSTAYLERARAQDAPLLTTGFYERRLPRWRNALDDGRLLLLTQRELKADPEAILQRAWAHIGLPPEPVTAELPRVNANSYPAPSAEVLGFLDRLYAGTVSALERDYGLLL